MTPRTVHEVLELAAKEWPEESTVAARIRALKSTIPDLPILQEGMVAVPRRALEGLMNAKSNAEIRRLTSALSAANNNTTKEKHNE